MSDSPGVELVDVVDEHDRVVGTVTRAEMRARRLRHRTVFVLVVSSDGRLLAHRRSDDQGPLARALGHRVQGAC